MQKGRTWAIPRYRHYIQRVNFKTKTLSYKLLLSNFLFNICRSIYHMVLNHQPKRNSDFILKSCQHFCFKLCYEHYKTRVSRHSGCLINDIKYWRTFSSTSFACLIHLSPEMLADEIQCTLRITIFILLQIWQNYVCFGDFLVTRTLFKIIIVNNNQYLNRVTPSVTGLVSMGAV